MSEAVFVFIGGIQPKTRVLDHTPRLCPACGLAQARLKRVDHVLSLFFIPLFSVKRGTPVLMCERCGYAWPPEWASPGMSHRVEKNGRFP
jgi:NMD protein affecting ribosome stability and mRNA decay